MPDHSWMKDVLIDVAKYAEIHGMSEVQAELALAIEALSQFEASATGQSADVDGVVVELSSRAQSSCQIVDYESIRLGNIG